MFHAARSLRTPEERHHFNSPEPPRHRCCPNSLRPGTDHRIHLCLQSLPSLESLRLHVSTVHRAAVHLRGNGKPMAHEKQTYASPLGMSHPDISNSVARSAPGHQELFFNHLATTGGN